MMKWVEISKEILTQPLCFSVFERFLFFNPTMLLFVWSVHDQRGWLKVHAFFVVAWNKHALRYFFASCLQAEEASPVDPENQGNTLASEAPLNPPPETQEKPNINGESPEAEKPQSPPPTNGHSNAKTADTELWNSPPETAVWQFPPTDYPPPHTHTLIPKNVFIRNQILPNHRDHNKVNTRDSVIPAVLTPPAAVARQQTSGKSGLMIGGHGRRWWWRRLSPWTVDDNQAGDQREDRRFWLFFNH